MKKLAFSPTTDGARRLFLDNLAAKAPNVAERYNLSKEEIADLRAGSEATSYWLDYLNRVIQYGKMMTQFKNELLNGVQAGITSITLPVQLEMPAPPVLVLPDVMGRALATANRIKIHKDYTEADGRDLGLEGTVADTDREGMKPYIYVRLVAGGHPEIVWKKGYMDGIEIYRIDETNQSMKLLAYDSHPNYIDTTPLPAAGRAEEWKYRAIYRHNDEQAGEWSDIISVRVSGI